MGIASDKEAARLLENVSGALFEALNDSMAAADVLARKLERQLEKPADAGVSDPREILTYLSVMRHDQHRILRVAENLRELAVFGLEEAELEKNAFDLNTLCADLIDTVHSLLPDMRLEFTPCPESCATTGDAARIERLLLNLLDNSLRHCGPGDRVAVSVRRDGEELTVVVEDNGQGLQKEALSTLYQDYLRRKEPGDAGKGVGLGLSVAELIAEKHGGRVFLETGEEGTRAIFTMPRRWSNQLRVPAGVYGRRMRGVLTALADVLQYQKYAPPYL